MDSEFLGQLTRILQLSITPVALISGVGLLLLSMTNRLGRVVDRSRTLAKEAGGDTSTGVNRDEMRALFRRARLLQISIALLAVSIFLSMVMVVVLFVMYIVSTDLTPLILTLFGICLLCLVSSISFFLGDIFTSIRYLHITMGRFVK